MDTRSKIQTLEALLAQEGNEAMNDYFQWPDNWGGC